MREHPLIALRTARAFEFDNAGQADLLQEILVALVAIDPQFPSRG